MCYNSVWNFACDRFNDVLCLYFLARVSWLVRHVSVGWTPGRHFWIPFDGLLLMHLMVIVDKWQTNLDTYLFLTAWLDLDYWVYVRTLCCVHWIGNKIFNRDLVICLSSWHDLLFIGVFRSRLSNPSAWGNFSLNPTWSTRPTTGCGASSISLWVHRNLFWQMSRDGTCMVGVCHTPRQPLQNHPSRHLGEWATPWSAEEILNGHHQRVDIPTNARITQKGLLLKRLEGDLCWIVPHAPLPSPSDDPIGQGTEMNCPLRLDGQHQEWTSLSMP